MVSGSPAPPGSLDWEIVSGFRRATPSWLGAGWSWGSPAQPSAPGKPRTLGPQGTLPASSLLSFPRLSLLSVYICLILSPHDSKMCKSIWRIETKCARRVLLPSQRHEGSQGCHQRRPRGRWVPAAPGVALGTDGGGGSRDPGIFQLHGRFEITLQSQHV